MGSLEYIRRRMAGDIVRAIGAARSPVRKGLREGVETWKDARDTLLSVCEFLSSKGGSHANLALGRMGSGSVGFHAAIEVTSGERRFLIGMLEIDDGPDAQPTVIVTVEDGSPGGMDVFYRNDRGLIREAIDAARAPDVAHVLRLLRDVAEAAYRRGDVEAAGAALGRDLVRMADTARQYEEIMLMALRHGHSEPEGDEDTNTPKPR